jgi:hypothetical protein
MILSLIKQSIRSNEIKQTTKQQKNSEEVIPIANFLFLNLADRILEIDGAVIKIEGAKIDDNVVNFQLQVIFYLIAKVVVATRQDYH